MKLLTLFACSCHELPAQNGSGLQSALVRSRGNTIECFLHATTTSDNDFNNTRLQKFAHSTVKSLKPYPNIRKNGWKFDRKKNLAPSCPVAKNSNPSSVRFRFAGESVLIGFVNIVSWLVCWQYSVNVSYKKVATRIKKKKHMIGHQTMFCD